MSDSACPANLIPCHTLPLVLVCTHHGQDSGDEASNASLVQYGGVSTYHSHDLLFLLPGGDGGKGEPFFLVRVLAQMAKTQLVAR